MALPEHLKGLAARVSNTRRWGREDQRGTLNLIDTAAVRRGLRAARQGRVFSLAIPFDEHGPQNGMIPGRENPQRRMLTINMPYTGDESDVCFSDDVVSMGVQAATHWDALAHAGYEGELYNQVPFSAVDEHGASKLGIDAVGPVVSRGLLADVARVRGEDPPHGSHAITGDDLDAAMLLGGLTAEPGDILLVRTGHMHWLDPANHGGDLDAARERFRVPEPGLSTQSVEWLRDHDIAAVATDTLSFECFPNEDEAVLMPVHMIHLRDMGLLQGQLWALDELAADCADDGQYDFLLCATPIPFTRAIGGPVAPTAVK